MSPTADVRDDRAVSRDTAAISHRAGDGVQDAAQLGIELIAADSPEAFVHDTPTAILVRQILGAVAQFEKAALVAKLKDARERVRRSRGKCEGRKAHAEINPEAVALAKRLHRASPKTGERMSLRRISAELKAAGYVNAHGREFNPNSIKSMVEGRSPAHRRVGAAGG